MRASGSSPAAEVVGVGFPVGHSEVRVHEEEIAASTAGESVPRRKKKA